jgi:hypothetical protein
MVTKNPRFATRWGIVRLQLQGLGRHPELFESQPPISSRIAPLYGLRSILPLPVEWLGLGVYLAVGTSFEETFLSFPPLSPHIFRRWIWITEQLYFESRKIPTGIASDVRL